MQRVRTGAGFYGLVFVAGFITFAMHEGGHWLAGTLLGHEAHYGLNGAGVRANIPWTHGMIIIAAGPAVTILQGLIALWLVEARTSAAAWVFLFWAAFMRFMATLITLWNPNDEARIGLELGLGTWPVPAMVTAGLFALLIMGSRGLRMSGKTLALSWVAASVAASAIVGLDMVMSG